MIDPKDWLWFGQPGHFCGAWDCHWHLHTHVGDICVSSVGEWYPEGCKGKKKPSDLGREKKSYYEVAAFPLDADGEMIPSEMSMQEFSTREAAAREHVLLCERAAAGEFAEEAARIRRKRKAEEEEEAKA